jgi:hypothetical protein
MRGILVILVPALALLGMMIYADSMAPDDQKPYQLSTLAKAGVECELISDKAAMKLPEGLAFQRLEKAGRQARVLENCMSDRGYQENPDWVLFAQLQAAQQVRANKISEAEAFENLRRKYMLVYQAEKSEPLYWQLSKKKIVKK